ncbi:MAG: plasmid stabilization protein, partial [Azospira oryzae]
MLHDSLLSKMTGIFDTFEHFNEVYTMMNIACDDGSTNVKL